MKKSIQEVPAFEANHRPSIIEIVFAVSVIWCVAASPSRAQTTIVSYNKTTTHLATTIPTAPPGYVYTELYSIGPLTVQAGDVVSVHLQQELTYTGTVNCMVAHNTLAATSATAVNHSSPGFVGYLVKNIGNNKTAADGTSITTATGSYQFTSNASNIYINASFYAYAEDGAPLNVPAGDYGELVAVVERGVTRYETTTMNLPQAPYRGGALKYVVPVDAPTLHVQYSLGPLGVPANTMVDARFELEATSEVPGDGSSIQRLGRRVFQATSSTATGGTPLFVNTLQGGIDWNKHHEYYSHVGGSWYGSAVTGAYFNSALYCYGWSGDPLYIEGPSSTAYGHFVVEMRPRVPGLFWKDTAINVATVDTTKRVLYAVGPIDIAAGQVLEISYSAVLAPTSSVAVDSQVIRTTSPTATTGTLVQRPLFRKVDPIYTYCDFVHSTAEQVGTAATGQYYNVVVWTTSGTCPVNDWGQLQVVARN